MSIDQIAMCCISIDSSQRALQTNGKFFQNYFRINGRKPKNIQRITRLGLCKRGGGGICADHHAF